MIQEDEYIIYLNQAKCAVTIKLDQTMKTGMLEKKIVITTRRVLFFESLSNVVAEIQYEIMQKKKPDGKKPQPEINQRISINEFPEFSFPVEQRMAKVIIDEEPSCHKYLAKLGLRKFLNSITGIVILKNLKKNMFELVAFPSLKDGFRFCKALVCAQAWRQYERYCQENQLEPNRLWVRNLSQLANNQKSAVFIDPDLFISGSRQEIKAFIYLFGQISFAHTFKHRYSIVNSQITEYCLQFLQSFQEKSHSLILTHCELTSLLLGNAFKNRLKLTVLMHLDLSHNNINDEVFLILQKLCKESKKFSYINLSYNQITLSNSTLFVNFLKSVQTALNLHLNNNKIQDTGIDLIEKYIIFTNNPPIYEIDLSFTKFSKKGCWRLFYGNLRFNKYHTYLNFILYPIPFNKDIFPENEIEYPITGKMINFNMHSALIEEFQQQSFMKHTLHQVLNPKNLGIKFIRKLPDNVKLPRNKREVNQTLELANRIENFIYAPQFVENMFALAQEIANFQFNLPPVSKQHYIKFLSDRLNEALFIRDHYAVRYIRMSLDKLGIDYEGYRPRLNKLQARDQIVRGRLSSILNLEVDELDINRLLDDMVRESLRLYLCDHGIQLIYYLKYLRDRWIQKLIHEGYNPENFIYKKLADQNMNFDDDVSEKDLVVPYEIKVQRNINQNFYLHPWKANYVILSQLHKQQYENCLLFIESSAKREKFAVYFERIEERIEFMRNQFTLFSNNGFKYSYNDLKINCARLLNIYKYIGDRNLYLEIPSIARKVPINRQKIISVINEKRFSREYHISNYPNLSEKVKKAGYYDYNGKMTRYIGQMFENQLKRMNQHLKVIFAVAERESRVNSKIIPNEIMRNFKQLVKEIRQALYPQQLKEEFYLRLLSWRKGKYMTNTELLKYISFFTFYLRPTLTLQKYIVAAVIDNEDLPMSEHPLCLVSDINKSTELNVQELERAYVERDWMSKDEKMIELMHTNGQMKIDVHFLTKKKVTISIPESKTVGNVVEIVTGLIGDRSDAEHFWLYLGYEGDAKDLIILEEQQHIGELFAQKDEKEKFFLFKRRIYSPEWPYIYRKESEVIINDLYYDVRHEYLLGSFFVIDEHMVRLAAEMMIIDVDEQAAEKKKKFTDLMQEKMKSLGKYYKGYIPETAIRRSALQPEAVVNQLKATLNQKIMKKQYTKIIQLKVGILQLFESCPQFMCSNYLFLDRNKKISRISLNIFGILVDTQDDLIKVRLEQIISIVPKSKFLLINYHIQESVLGKVSLFGTQNQIISAAQDILSYCVIRIRMLSSSLYGMYRYKNLIDRKQVLGKNAKQEIKRMKMRLGNLNPTILQMKHIIYNNPNRYIKVFIPRKLYANASQENLQMEAAEEDPEYGDQSMEDLRGHNVFNTIFPKVAKMQEKDSQDNSMQERSNSLYKRQYEKIPGLSPINQQQPVQSPQYPREESRMTSSKDIYDSIGVSSKPQPEAKTPAREDPDRDFEPITTAKRSNKGTRAPKGNR